MFVKKHTEEWKINQSIRAKKQGFGKRKTNCKRNLQRDST